MSRFRKPKASFTPTLEEAQASLREEQAFFEAQRLRVRHLQRQVWRIEQSLEISSHTDDEIEADPLFRIRFPDEKAV